MRHTIPFALESGKGTVARFARGPARRLVVFIHGFHGAATKTWAGLDGLTDSQPTLADSDLVFFGYLSTARATLSAGVFRSFLDSAAECGPSWKQIVASSGVERGDCVYDEIVIMAHSLGAAVARRAILDAIDTGQNWPRRTRLVLFAPAHLGSRLPAVQRLMQGTIGNILGNLYAISRARMPVLDDLEPESRFIADLVAETERLLNADAAWKRPLRAERVIFGDGEDVVEVGRFCQDPPPDVWQGQDHCSICRCPKTPAAVMAHLA